MSPWRLFSFGIISLLTLLAYYPSLSHVPRSDQIIYYYVTADFHSWWQLAISCFDLNRWGTFAPGDEKLFRPLVYFILGNEKYFFGYDFYLWQAVGIILHLAVVWYVLKLLWRMQSGLLATACTLFFALMMMNMEMVIWTHINSYIAFVLLMLIALDQMYVLIVDKKDDAWRIGIIGFCFLGAGFIYETANLMAIITFVALLKKKNSWSLIVPSIIFFICNFLNAQVHHIIGMSPSFNLTVGIKHAIVACGFWLTCGFWPWSIELLYDGARNIISEHSVNLLASYLLVVLFGISLILVLKQINDEKRKFLYLILCLIFTYALVIALGRAQVHGLLWTLSRNTHYPYMFWAFGIIIVGVLLSSIKVKGIQRMVAVVLIILSVCQGFKLYQINDIQAQGTKQNSILCRAVELLIEEKKNEKDFTFYISPNYPGNYPYSDQWGRKTSFIGMLFPKYYSEVHPKYRL